MTRALPRLSAHDGLHRRIAVLNTALPSAPHDHQRMRCGSPTRSKSRFGSCSVAVRFLFGSGANCASDGEDREGLPVVGSVLFGCGSVRVVVPKANSARSMAWLMSLLSTQLHLPKSARAQQFAALPEAHGQQATAHDSTSD